MQITSWQYLFPSLVRRAREKKIAIENESQRRDKTEGLLYPGGLAVLAIFECQFAGTFVFN